MLISQLKVVAQTSNDSNPNASFFFDFIGTFDGEDGPSAGGELRLPGEPLQTKEFVVQLRKPVDTAQKGVFTFDVDLDGGGNPAVYWQPASLTIYGAAADSNWMPIAGGSISDTWFGAGNGTPANVTPVRHYELKS